MLVIKPIKIIMSLKIIVFCIFISLNSIAQNVYVFKSDVLQVSFPVKPFFDTVTVAGGFKVRSVASRDSISNYYLSIIEKVNPDSNNVQNTQNLKEYFDGVMDGFGERYRSETISQKIIRVSADSVGEYYSKGYYGQTPINIRSWVCLKGVRTIVCQHLYTVKDKDALKRKQEIFFQSLILL
jgi:hypothetical protein